MKVQAFVVLCVGVGLIALTGCGSSTGASGSFADSPDLTGNWQIQSNVIAGSVPPVGVLLLGALQSSGNQVTGTFRFNNLSQPTACGLNQIVTLTGAIDAKDNLTLTSATLPNGTTIKIALGISATQKPYTGTGTIEVDGTTCAFPSTSATGDQFQNASGTFIGTMTPGTLLSPGSGPSAAISLTLTQSATPQSDGQFPATGSLSYTIGSCSGNVSLSGTVSGAGVALSVTNPLSSLPGNFYWVTFIGTANPAATTITLGVLASAPAPCSTDPNSHATYSGSLNRQ